MNTTIKKTIIIIALFLVTVISSYAADIPGTDTVTFDRIHGRDWNLARVIKGSAIIVIDRTNVQREIYNLRFKGNCLIGRGADNLYRAFYTAGKNNNLSIGKIVCT
ncbi:MAG: hypothetical protein LBI04_02480, partial [Treponema sp.]|nr:hypothetical protein [Treponema sp.]